MDADILDDAMLHSTSVSNGAMLDGIDDLFGESTDVLPPTVLSVPLQHSPLPAKLLLRLAEMRGNGCCTGLDWSSTGSIAQISNQGHEINFFTLLRDQKTGSWDLTEHSDYALPAPKGATWRHIQFSNIGVDLAAIDSLGKVHIHSIVGFLGNMPEAPQGPMSSGQQSSDLDTIVGLYWLPVWPTEVKIPYITPAQKFGDKWVTNLNQRAPNELAVHHAADSRHALLHLSRHGKLTLMYQTETAWQSTHVDVEILDANDLLTHASMCEDGAQILLVTYGLARRLRVYRVSISWNVNRQTRPDGSSVLASISPVLEVSYITISDDLSSEEAGAVPLTQLHLLPSMSRAASSNVTTFPTILAVFSHTSPTSGLGHQPTDYYTVISRWYIDTTPIALHDAFSRTNASAAHSTNMAATVLQRQMDVVTSRAIISMKPQYYNTAIAFIASDGTMELRERTTLATIETSYDPTIVSSLTQCGFDQLALVDEHSSQIACSPDCSIFVYQSSTKKLRSKAMSFSWQVLDISMGNNDALVEAAVVCLAREYAVLCCSNASNDDILALIPADLDSNMRALFIREILRMTARAFDVTTQDPKQQTLAALKDPILTRLISAQSIIGVKPGTTSSRTIMGSFANGFLNMRFVCTALAPLFGRQELSRPEVLHSFRGLVTWGADVLVYLVDNILNLSRNLPANQPWDQAALEKLIGNTENPILHFLLCPYTRFYSRYLATLVPKCVVVAQKVAQFSRSVQERQELVELIQYCASLPFKCAQFDALIGDLDDNIRTAYSRGNFPLDRRREMETSILIGDHKIPSELVPPLQGFFETVVVKFASSVDMEKLYFWETDRLGLSGKESAKRAQQYDGVWKLPLTQGVKTRVCRRCGTRTEEITQGRSRETPMWLPHAQKYCICLNFWVPAKNGE